MFGIRLGLHVPRSCKHLQPGVRGVASDGDYATRVESARSDELGRLIDDFDRLGNSLQKTESSRRDFMALEV